MKSPQPSFRNKPKKSAKGAWVTFTAFVLTLGWFGIVGFYVIKAGGFTSFLESTGAAAIVAVTGLMLAPAAIMWMMFAYMKRAYDVEAATEPLLKQLALITGQGGIAEGRVRRFNDALGEQLGLLKQTGDVTNRVAEEALATLRLEREEMSQAQHSFTTDINILLNTMRGQTAQLESLVQTGQAQLSMIVNKTHDISDIVNKQTDSTEARLSDLLAAIAGTLDEVGRMADERIGSLEHVTERMAAREKDMRSEASITARELEDAANTVNEAMNVFKQMAYEGRVEADRLIASLQSHTVAVDNSSQQMVGRVAATRDMVEQMAHMLNVTAERFAHSGGQIHDDITERVQALADAATALDVTASKISGTLDTTTHDFTRGQDHVAKLYEDVITKLRAESIALVQAGDAIAERSELLGERVQTSMNDLQRTTSESFTRYENISIKAEDQAAAVAENFNSAMVQYEGAAKRLNNAAADLQALAERCGDTLTSLDQNLTQQVSTLAETSDKVAVTSRDVKADAADLVTTLQGMIDRLESVRAGVGSTTDTALIKLNDISNATSRQFTALETVASSALEKLGQAGEFAGEQAEYVESKLKKFENTYNALKNDSEETLGVLMRQLQASCDNMGAMIDGFGNKVTAIQPALQAEAEKAAELAAATVDALSGQAGLFSQKLAQENGRWAMFVDDQSRAFGDTFKELQKQLEMVQEAHGSIMRSSGAAADKIYAQTSALGEVEARVAKTGSTQVEQLKTLKEELDRTLDYMQRQALSLGSITQQAVENVRGASEVFGEQAFELNQVAKVSETVLTDITQKMGVASGNAEMLQSGLNTLRNEVMKVTDALEGYFTNLRDESEKTIFANDKMVEATRTGFTQLQDMTTTLHMAAEQAAHARAVTMAALEDVAGRIGEETDALGARGRTIVGIITHTANLMDGKTDALFANLQRTADQMKAADATMGQLEKQASLMRVQLVDEAENMIVALDKVTQDLTSRLATIRSTGDSAVKNAASEADAITLVLERATEELSQSATMLKDVSKEANITLDVFSSNLSTEIESLGYAQNKLKQLCDGAVTSEQQIASVVSGLTASTGKATGDLQTLAAQLAEQHETLAGRQADVFAKMNEALSLIGRASNALAGSGVDALEMATAVETRFSTIADFADKVVTEKAQALALSATTAEQSMQNYALIASSSADAMQQQQSNIGKLTQTLRADLDAAEARLVSLSDKVTAAGIATSGASSEVIGKLSTAVQSILHEFSNVNSMAEASARTVQEQSHALRREVEEVAKGAREAAGITAGALDDLQIRAHATQEVLADDVARTINALAEAEAKYSAMASTLGQSESMARTALSHLTHTFTDILETATRSLDQLKGEFETTALAATGTLNQSQDMLADKSAAFSAMGEKITGVVEMLGSKSSSALETLHTLVGFMESTQNKATDWSANTTSQLHELVSVLEQRQQQLALGAEETTAKLSAASKDVLREVGGLVEQTLRADSSARMISASIAAAANDAGAAVNQFERDAERLSAVANTTAQQTEKAAQTVQLGTDTAIKALEANSAKLEATTEKVISVLENETNRFRATTSLSEAQMERFSELVAAKAMDFLQVSETLAHQGARLESQVAKFAGDTLHAVEKLAAAQEAAGEMSINVVGRVGTATDAMADRIVMLDDRAKQTAETLDATGRAVMAQATTLQNHAQMAEAQVGSVRNAIDELKSSAASLKGDIASETEALSLALAKALKELEGAGDALYRQSQQTQTAVSQMGQTLAVSTRDLSEVTQTYQREQEQIRTNAQTVLADTARVLGEFYGFKNHMTGQVDDLTAQMASVASNAEERMHKLAGHLKSIVTEIGNADTLLSTKLNTLGGDHTKLRQEVERSVQLMANASGRLREVSSDAYAEIEDLAARMASLRHAAGSEVTNQVTHLRAMVESASVLLHDLGKQLEGQTRTVETAHTDIVKRAGTVSDQTRNALQQLKALTEKLENAKLVTSSVASGAAGKLSDILESIEGKEGTTTVDKAAGQ